MSLRYDHTGGFESKNITIQEFIEKVRNKVVSGSLPQLGLSNNIYKCIYQDEYIYAKLEKDAAKTTQYCVTPLYTCAALFILGRDKLFVYHCPSGLISFDRGLIKDMQETTIPDLYAIYAHPRDDNYQENFEIFTKELGLLENNTVEIYNLKVACFSVNSKGEIGV